MSRRRWPAARIAKLWLEIAIGVLALAGAVMVVLLLVGLVWRPPDAYLSDLTVQVSVGEQISRVPAPRALAAAMPLKISAAPSGEPDEFRNPMLVKTFGELRLDTSNAGLYCSSMLSLLGAVAVVLWLLWTLRALVVSALDGAPFTRRNVRRLSTIGFAIIGLGLVAPVLQYLLARAVLARAAVEGLPMAPAFRLSADPILGGLLVLVLAAVFSYGVDIEEERSLTI